MDRFYCIENNTLKQAPSPLLVDGRHIFTTDEEIYNAQGYYKLKAAEHPDDGKSYESHYTLEGNEILQSWVEVEPTKNEVE